MMMKGPLREVIPLGPQRVQVRLPGSTTIKQVQLLTAGSRLPMQQAGGVLTVTVPSIDVHEVIAVDL